MITLARYEARLDPPVDPAALAAELATFDGVDSIAATRAGAATLVRLRTAAPSARVMEALVAAARRISVAPSVPTCTISLLSAEPLPPMYRLAVEPVEWSDTVVAAISEPEDTLVPPEPRPRLRVVRDEP